MQVVITQWGLDSYLELKHGRVFSPAEYWGEIRPDVLRLKVFPDDPKFRHLALIREGRFQCYGRLS